MSDSNEEDRTAMKFEPHCDPADKPAPDETAGSDVRASVVHIRSAEDLERELQRLTGGKIPEEAKGIAQMLGSLFGQPPSPMEIIRRVPHEALDEEKRASRSAQIRKAVENLLANIDDIDGALIAFRTAKPDTRVVDGETQHGHTGIVEIGVIGAGDVLEALIACTIEHFEESVAAAQNEELVARYGTDDVEELKRRVNDGEMACPGCGKYHGGTPVSQGGTIPDDQYEPHAHEAPATTH